MGDPNGHVGRNIDGCQWVHGGYSIGEKNHDGKMLLEFCDARHLCIANTLFRNVEMTKITYGLGCNEGEMDVSMMGKVVRKLMKMSRLLQGSGSII